jgi:DNA-binding XRE family transcriptional regulator
MGSKVRPADPPPRTVITDVGQIGYLFRQARRSTGMSCATLAAKLGIRSPSTIIHREIGKTYFDGLQHALDQAAALGYQFVLEPVEPGGHPPPARGVIVTDSPTEPFPATYETRP